MEWNRVRDKRVCLNCGSDTTYKTPKGHVRWRKYKDGWMCQRCYTFVIDNPKYYPLCRDRIMLYKYKKKMMKEKPRKGVCSRCSKKIGDPFLDKKGKPKFIKRTNMHHWFYLVIMPWACAEEVCAHCHGQITMMERSDKPSLLAWTKKRPKN